MTHPEKPKPPRVRSAARAIEVLISIANSNDGLTVSQIVEELGATRQSVYHLLHTLESLEVIQRSANRNYIYGPGLLPVITTFLRQFTPQQILTPIVAQLAQQTGETAYAASWLGREVTVIASAAGAPNMRMGLVSTGTIGDTHARASGKLLLSMQSDNALEQFIESHDFVPRTPNTITDADEFRRDIELIRELGYATDLGEYEEATYCVAMPYFPIPNCVLAVSAPRARFNQKKESYIDALRQTGAKFRTNTQSDF